MTIQEVAQEMLDNMETRTRDNGRDYRVNGTTIEWQKDIIHKAHGDKLPDDYVYVFIWEALCALAECEPGDEDDAILQIEPDVYTSELTAWLNSRCDRVGYMTEAIEEGAGDGFAALMTAQGKEKSEVGYLVLAGIREYIGK